MQLFQNGAKNECKIRACFFIRLLQKYYPYYLSIRYLNAHKTVILLVK